VQTVADLDLSKIQKFSKIKMRIRPKELSWQEESNAARFFAIYCLIMELWPFKFFTQAKIREGFFPEIFCRESEPSRG
jgi:hypothetical protein